MTPLQRALTAKAAATYQHKLVAVDAAHAVLANQQLLVSACSCGTPMILHSCTVPWHCMR